MCQTSQSAWLVTLCPPRAWSRSSAWSSPPATSPPSASTPSSTGYHPTSGARSLHSSLPFSIFSLHSYYVIFQGVDNSKSILETILSKIKLYEKGHFKKLDEVLKVGHLHLARPNIHPRESEASTGRPAEVSCSCRCTAAKIPFVLATGNSN